MYFEGSVADAESKNKYGSNGNVCVTTVSLISSGVVEIDAITAGAGSGTEGARSAIGPGSGSGGGGGGVVSSSRIL
jgi:hypothetical protein